MCGIIGSINHRLGKEALFRIAHRGPDDSGWFEYKNVSLGHVRLSIQDVSEMAHQPFLSKDGNTVMVFNGEIYNHWEIRKGLEEKGVSFKSTSDTETILEGYLMFGTQVFEMLNGIFALCIYDLLTEKAVLVRDRFGVKPLYYSFEDNKFQFSSELKALEFDANELDYESIANYVKYLWSPGKGTPSKQIKKMLPGELMTINNGNGIINIKSKFIQSKKFDGTRLLATEEELVDTLDSLLVQAVQRQLLSDVPVGFFLSGGLDSSLLVAIARKLNPSLDLQCFTIDTTSFSKSEGFSNDLDYARLVANHLNVKLEVVTSEVEIAKDFDHMIWHLDEPQADPAPLNVLNISKRAAVMGFKVLIGGAGGDDVFSGYRRHQMLKYEAIISKVPHFILKAVGNCTNLIKANTPNKRRVKKFLGTLTKPKNDRIFTYFDWLDWSVVKDLFKSDIKEKLNILDEYSFFRAKIIEIPKEHNSLNQMLHLEMSSFLVDHNFNYTDKMGMAVGVEIRVPFLDNDLVDFSYSIPPELKLKNNVTKYILKKVAERYLPNEVIYRSKAGFGAPVRKWVTEDLSDLVESRLNRVNIEKQKIFDYDRVFNLIDRNKKGEIDASYSIWAILAIDSWVRQFTKERINP
jgi:asparagine synthase (glutamine-hydrolysing)